MTPEHILLNEVRAVEGGEARPPKDLTLATVLDGDYRGRVICILVEFDDGDCVVEFSETEGSGLALIPAASLSRWRRVQSVNVSPCPACPAVNKVVRGRSRSRRRV